ncbi:putative tartrate transporter [Zancudomyces culisetae]|uniref:Putative tartrate transporter n=1 Tax=Zancudomyces culisetae TaxID=1213189 RepID=A0A1R1PKJ4_ZANCU|nr:putative tartrate transporter [Zancudomyces culisetae]|eukprot:OMH81467.1 putative tartrate transporter [Zancudomyces culisetae]
MKGDEIELGKEEVTLNTQVVLTEEEIRYSKKILKKLDTRLLPMLVVLYVGSFMDRTNIGAALVNGLIDGLKLDSGLQTLVTSIFYVFYVSLEIPSNVLLKKIKPRNWFTFISVSWSIICMLQAIAKTPAVFIVFRALLGAIESGFSPGIVAYLPYWYTRGELGLRMSIFFSALPVAGIIGNPIAAGLASLKTSLEPYQMIFLVEGAATLVCGVVAFFILQNYPETCTFLTIEERDVLVKKLKADQGLATKAKLSLSEFNLSSNAPMRSWASGYNSITPNPETSTITYEFYNHGSCGSNIFSTDGFWKGTVFAYVFVYVYWSYNICWISYLSFMAFGKPRWNCEATYGLCNCIFMW